MKLISVMRNPIYFFIFLGFFSIFSSLQLYLMITLPGTNGYSCIPGANITNENMVFAIMISFMTSLLGIGIIRLINTPKKCDIILEGELTGLAAIAATIGTFTIFCTLCTLPVLSIFGLSIGLTFFTTYNLIFKILSLVILAVGILQVEKKLR